MFNIFNKVQSLSKHYPTSGKGCSAYFCFKHLTPPLAPSKGEVHRATSASRS